MKYIILFLSSCLFLSCSDEQIITPLLYPVEESTVGLKSKVFFNETGQVIKITDYEYDLNGLVKKISYFGANRETLFSYELFNYDTEGKLLVKYNYHGNRNSPDGFILLDSTYYTYLRHQLILETRQLAISVYKYSYEYEYKNNFVYKKTSYENNELKSYTIFTYMDNKLSEEITYSSTRDIISRKEYYFKGSLLMQIVIYDSRNDARRRITYSYNEYGKMIFEKVEELNIFSSTKPYTVEYIY